MTYWIAPPNDLANALGSDKINALMTNRYGAPTDVAAWCGLSNQDVLS